MRRRAVLGDRTRLGHAPLAAATVAVLAAAGMTTEQLFAWGERLPRGDEARVAYVVGGNTLVSGARRADLGPGVQAELRAPLPRG